MKIDYDFAKKQILIDCADHSEMDNLRILMKTIKDYGTVLEKVSDYDLSMQKVIDTVATQNKLGEILQGNI